MAVCNYNYSGGLAGYSRHGYLLREEAGRKKEAGEAPKTTEQTATEKESAEEAITKTGEQTPEPNTSGTTTPADNTADNSTSSEINITLPNIKPVNLSTSTVGLPIGGIKAPQPVIKNVYLYNDSLTPANLEVSVNTKVVWKNKQWVVHLLVDRTGDFQSGMIGQNEEYSYTFTKPGTHEYYDHYNKTITGKIVVK